MRLAKLARGNAFKFAKVFPQRCVVDAAHRSLRHEYVRPTRLQPLDAADKGAHDPWRTRHVAKLTITVQTPWLFNGRMSLLEGTIKLIKRVGPPSSVLVRTDERGQQRVLEAPGPAGPSWQCPPASASGAGPRPAELANRRPKPAPAGLGTGSRLRLELMSPLRGRRCPAEPGPARCWGGLSQGAESPMGIGDGGPSPSPANRGCQSGWGFIIPPILANRGLGWGCQIPVILWQIGDGTPAPSPTIPRPRTNRGS